MIKKVYEISCDKCGSTITHHVGNKPSLKKLRNICIVIINNSHIFTYCYKCAESKHEASR